MKCPFYILKFLLLLCIASGELVNYKPSYAKLDFSYHSNRNIMHVFNRFKFHFPTLCTIISIGKSVRGRELYAIRLTSLPRSRIGTPSVKIIGTIRGNEPVGHEIVLHFIEHLLLSYGIDKTITFLLDNTFIYFIPIYNPDGYKKAVMGDCEGDHGRTNNNSVDLTFDFPHLINAGEAFLQPETLSLIHWMKTIPFVLALNFRGEAFVVAYPYFFPLQVHPDQSSSVAGTPDDDVFRSMALNYARMNPSLSQNLTCGPYGPFPDGVVNGGSWMARIGTMSDYNYIYNGCLQLSVRAFCCKFPPEKDLQKIVEENLAPLTNFVKEAHQGVKGVLYDGVDGKPIANASIAVKGRVSTFRSSSEGEFWRILLPGRYTLQVEAKGYISIEVPFTVKRECFNESTATVLNIILAKSDSNSSNSEFSSNEAPTSKGTMINFIYLPVLSLIGYQCYFWWAVV